MCSWRKKIGDQRDQNIEKEDCPECEKDDIYKHWNTEKHKMIAWHEGDDKCVRCKKAGDGEWVAGKCRGESVKYSTTGYTLQADVYFPEEAKEYLKAYPPLFINKLVKEDDLSKEQLSEFKENGGAFTETHKLCPTLESSTDIIMDSNMACMLSLLGAEVTVKSGIKYFASKYMKSWVEHCTKLRIEASRNGDDLGVNLFKLILNRLVFFIFLFIALQFFNYSVFGKHLQDDLKFTTSTLTRYKIKKIIFFF